MAHITKYKKVSITGVALTAITIVVGLTLLGIYGLLKLIGVVS